MSEYVVELKNATKRFPGVVALKNMQLSVKPVRTAQANLR